MTKKTLALALCASLSWSYVTASTEMTEQEKWAFVKKAIVDKTELEQNWLIPRVAGTALVRGTIVAAPFLAFMFLINYYWYNRYDETNGCYEEEDSRSTVKKIFGLPAAILGISSAAFGAKTGLSHHKLKKLHYFADYIRNWDNYKDKTPQELLSTFEALHDIYQKLTLIPEHPEAPQDLSELYLQKIFYQKYNVIKKLIESQTFNVRRNA